MKHLCSVLLFWEEIHSPTVTSRHFIASLPSSMVSVLWW